MAASARAPKPDPHIPVLLRPLIAAVSPVAGVWLDGTFGAGGYTRALLEAGADKVIAIDRDPSVFGMVAQWAGQYGDRLRLVEGKFSDLNALAEVPLDGVVLDLGVSSMQLDQAERGFSFMSDGPLDMRMSGQGPDAADLVNRLCEGELADILYHFGEERASRRIARAIVRARAEAPIERTLQLAEIVLSCLPRAKPGQSHPATRSFQALRIAVNGEYEQLADGLEAAERALKPGGQLAVVSFHSIEDRMVKRFFQQRSGGGGGGSRHAPEQARIEPRFKVRTRRAVGPDDRELAENPRARSSKLRVAIRTGAPAGPCERAALGMPHLPEKGARH
ncbi:MAG: 16S rRNA (cytosine(1402)-N(4))-methyltransferase RsmH [Rhodobacteraceae bacterium]|nr:16S rRNA (cytosine(1402)-N(4))-methyltransferase RsmH [Paracoccaceae bacterium]